MFYVFILEPDVDVMVVTKMCTHGISAFVSLNVKKKRLLVESERLFDPLQASILTHMTYTESASDPLQVIRSD